MNDKIKNLIVVTSKWILSITMFVVFWQILVLIPSVSIIPGPFEVFQEFGNLWQDGIFGVYLWEHALSSLGRVLLGFSYSFIIAVPLGLILGYFKILSSVINPIIELLRPIPPIAWIPFSIMVFGITTMSHTFVIFTGAFFPLFQNAYDAVKGTKRVWKDVAMSLGASKSQVISSVLLPSIAPNIFTGSRISLGIAWMCVIAAEMIGIPSNKGIGLFILNMQSIGRYGSMIAGMLMIGFVGILIAVGIQNVEKILLKWRE